MATISRFCLMGILALTILLGLASCGNHPAPDAQEAQTSQRTVDPRFRSLFQDLGGVSVLGPAISDVFQQGDVFCQFTTNVLLCYNPNVNSEADRAYVAPIGLEINFSKLNPRLSTVYTVYESFEDAYHKQFFGVRNVGLPISNISYNTQLRRYEQYFEKMGFYILLDDPQKIVHLIAYGSYVCKEYCANSTIPPSGSAAVGTLNGIEILNPASLSRLGGFVVLGYPLTVPYVTKDGYEQVLENVVIYITPDNPSTIHLRSLVKALNLPTTPPGKQRTNLPAGTLFYLTNNELGYHVPKAFDTFIAKHGSTEISGKPLSDYESIDRDGVRYLRQCFENYCLEYNTTLPEEKGVTMLPLGKDYIKAQKYENKATFKFSPSTVEVIASETRPKAATNDAQALTIAVRTREGRYPIGDIEAYVTITLPNKSEIKLNFPTTNRDGITSVAVPSIPDAHNGTIIPYKVCLNVPSDEPICTKESYLIWNFK